MQKRNKTITKIKIAMNFLMTLIKEEDIINIICKHVKFYLINFIDKFFAQNDISNIQNNNNYTKNYFYIKKFKKI